MRKGRTLIFVEETNEEMVSAENDIIEKWAK